MKKDIPNAEEFELTPAQARIRGATLRGYNVDVQLVGDEYIARAIGLLSLPGNKGKRTGAYEARARDATVAVAQAMVMISRNFPARPAPVLGSEPPKAG